MYLFLHVQKWYHVQYEKSVFKYFFSVDGCLDKSLTIICGTSTELRSAMVGGGSFKEGRKLLSDPVGPCEVYNLLVSTNPPPHFHMQRTWLCVGGWGSWLCKPTPTACPAMCPTVCSESWRGAAILVWNVSPFTERIKTLMWNINRHALFF